MHIPRDEYTEEREVVGPHEVHEHTQGELEEEQTPYHAVHAVTPTQTQEEQVIDVRRHE